MSAVALATRPTVFRREVTYVVLPADLARFHGSVTTWFVDQADVQVLVERRSVDRRSRAGQGPDGVDRRQGTDRREAKTTAAELELELPWTVARHAARIPCARRALPVSPADAACEADELFGLATAGDGAAREELRLRFHPWVHAMVLPVVGRRRALATTEKVFDAVFAAPGATEFRLALTLARERVLGN